MEMSALYGMATDIFKVTRVRDPEEKSETNFGAQKFLAPDKFVGADKFFGADAEKN